MWYLLVDSFCIPVGYLHETRACAAEFSGYLFSMSQGKGACLDAAAALQDDGGASWDGKYWTAQRAEQYWLFRHEYQLLILQQCPEEFDRIWPDCVRKVPKGPGRPPNNPDAKRAAVASQLRSLRIEHKDALRSANTGDTVANGVFRQSPPSLDYLPTLIFDEKDGLENEQMVNQWQRVLGFLKMCEDQGGRSINSDAIGEDVKDASTAFEDGLEKRPKNAAEGLQTRCGIMFGPPGTGKVRIADIFKHARTSEGMCFYSHSDSFDSLFC